MPYDFSIMNYSFFNNDLLGVIIPFVRRGGEVTLDGRQMPKVDKFKYLDSIIQQNGDVDEDINKRIRVG